MYVGVQISCNITNKLDSYHWNPDDNRNGRTYIYVLVSTIINALIIQVDHLREFSHRLS